MSKGRRIALTVVLLLFVVIGGGVLYLNSQLDSIVAGLIEKHGSAATQTDVRVGGVSIELKEARAGLSGLTVANPEGYGGAPAVELGNFSVQIEPGSVTTDTIVLNDVAVSGARLRLLQQGASSNLQVLLDNLRGGGTAGDDAESAGGKKVIIERFVLEDARAFVSLPDFDEEREVTLPTIVLNDIGRASNGATAAEATRQILEPILRRTMQSAAAQAVKDRAADKLDEAGDKVLEGVLDKLGGDDEQ
ncbi:MAG: hypothetical protein U5K76_09410 [Woeseiaceae bacterium]|nr:hypothetical protein [Woeseiaceae bacterium]